MRTVHEAEVNLHNLPRAFTLALTPTIRRAGTWQGLRSRLSWPSHERLLSCVERGERPVLLPPDATLLTRTLLDWNCDKYMFVDLETTNTALHNAQTADDAEKAAQPATGVPETEEHPSHVQRYVADRKRLLADRWKVGLPCLDCEQC